MTQLTICALQANLAWQNPEANRNYFAGQFAVHTRIDVFVLPEMFASGFSMSGKAIAEPEQGPTLQWLREQASINNAAITGSIAVVAAGQCFNRMYWVTPDGLVEYYDKRHLFRMAGEHQRYAAGESRKIVSWRGMRFLLQVCYDLRFPVFSRNFQCSPEGDYDAAIYVASWPAARRHAWRSLLPARAIENQAFVIGVNRVGRDAKGLEYSGDSGIYNYLGEPLIEVTPGEVAALTTLLDLDALNAFRQSFPVGLDSDSFTLL